MAVPAELMALLQGGGGAPPGLEGGMAPGAPPGLEGGMAPAPAEEPMPAEEPAGGLYGGAGGGGAEPLKAALDALQAYAQQEDDEAHIQAVLKCITALQAILAEEQKMSDSMMSGKADPRALRMFAGGAPA